MNAPDVPIGLVVLGCALAWLIVRIGESIADAVRRRRGLPTADHCEHCADVEALRDQLTTLTEFAGDSFGVLEEIRDAIGEIPQPETDARHGSDTRTHAIPQVPPCTSRAPPVRPLTPPGPPALIARGRNTPPQHRR